MSLQSGSQYKLVNVQSSTAADLSGTDNTTVNGYSSHEGPNQKWIPKQKKEGWIFRNVSHPEKYLGFHGEPKNGVAIVAVEYEHAWEINFNEEGNFRITPPDATQFSIALSANGNSDGNTPMTLSNGGNQLWRAEQV